jgi:hypothetical protein
MLQERIIMAKFTTRKEQLSIAHKLLVKLQDKNTGGVSPIIKSIILDKYIKRLKDAPTDS